MKVTFSLVVSAVVYGLGDEGSKPTAGSLPCERDYEMCMLLFSK